MAARKVARAPIVSHSVPWVEHVPGEPRTFVCRGCDTKWRLKMDSERGTGIDELRWIEEFNGKLATFLNMHAKCKEGEE